jgi:arginyl-tRNA--protein-N-Asp/Glu arginylyltransferase
MTASLRDIRVYTTFPHACSYLPDQEATTLFIDRTGVVRKIHTGFSGPATGKHYEKLVADFTSTVDALLSEPAPRS